MKIILLLILLCSGCSSVYSRGYSTDLDDCDLLYEPQCETVVSDCD